MRRPIALLLMLWLPLQAIAGLSAPACGGPNKTMVTSVADAGVEPAPASQGHEHHASVAGSAHGAHHGATLDDTNAAGAQCGDCVLACAVCVQSRFLSSVQRVLGAGPLQHGDEVFASAIGNRALEPPIAAA